MTAVLRENERTDEQTCFVILRLHCRLHMLSELEIGLKVMTGFPTSTLSCDNYSEFSFSSLMTHWKNTIQCCQVSCFIFTVLSRHCVLFLNKQLIECKFFKCALRSHRIAIKMLFSVFGASFFGCRKKTVGWMSIMKLDSAGCKVLVLPDS